MAAELEIVFSGETQERIPLHGSCRRLEGGWLKCYVAVPVPSPPELPDAMVVWFYLKIDENNKLLEATFSPPKEILSQGSPESSDSPAFQPAAPGQVEGIAVDTDQPAGQSPR